MAKKRNDEERLALDANEVFACEDESKDLSFAEIADLNMEAEPPSRGKSSRMDEITRGCDTNFITILLAQAGLDYSDETVEKVYWVLKQKGLEVSEKSVIAAFHELEKARV